MLIEVSAPGRGVTGIFFLRGQSQCSWFFSRCEMLFPGRNFYFGRPKTNFSGFQKWEKKKKVLSSFCNFYTFHFQYPIFPFTIFLLFSIFTPFPIFPCLFFPRSEVSGARALGALCPPPHLLCHWLQEHNMLAISQKCILYYAYVANTIDFIFILFAHYITNSICLSYTPVRRLIPGVRGTCSHYHCRKQVGGSWTDHWQ